ncbi:undecaprenyl-phosphate glucose phosphotransferase [Bradyrhizobium sp. McL0616]|uniref:undecaprenyl-phosphate glucose phosphotransferase n=1 Tax=Bradyrhizobium sp. McL0616 TaxID=3415674 RepID=UPI003CEEA08E
MLTKASDISDSRNGFATSPPLNFGISIDAIPYILSTIDFVTVLLSSLIGGLAYQFAAGNSVPSLLPYYAVGSLAGIIYVLRMSGRGFYRLPNGGAGRVEIGEILACWCTTVLLLAFAALIFKVGADYSRGSFLSFSSFGLLALVVLRKVAKLTVASAISRRTIGQRRTVMLGVLDEMQGLEHLLPYFGTAEIKRFVLNAPSPLSGIDEDIGTICSIADFIRNSSCREILLALPWADTERIEFVRSRVKTLPVAVRLLPDKNVQTLSGAMSLDRIRALTVNIQNAPLNDRERLLKRMLDILFATLALVFFAPIMAITAAAIKLDSPGPIIFRQHRKGYNGNHFVIFKFRTMTVQENGSVVSQATREDPRITEIGRTLRSLSIDELPQLFNVLRGEMSLVGPRPHALAHDNHFEKLLRDYALRHHVKPGITGWAQCNGARGETPEIEQMSARVRLDLWYIDNWSLKLDFLILIKTIVEVLGKRNAY